MKKRLYKLATPFLITKNLKRMFYVQYLTEEQFAFLFELVCYVGYGDNKIHPQKLIDKRNFTPSKLVEFLATFVKKGIVFVQVDSDDLNQPLFIEGKFNPLVKLYMNPEVCFNGRLKEVPLNLIDMVYQNKQLENDVGMVLKVVYKEGREFGFFVNKDTYLEAFQTLKR